MYHLASTALYLNPGVALVSSSGPYNRMLEEQSSGCQISTLTPTPVLHGDHPTECTMLRAAVVRKCDLETHGERLSAALDGTQTKGKGECSEWSYLNYKLHTR